MSECEWLSVSSPGCTPPLQAPAIPPTLRGQIMKLMDVSCIHHLDVNSACLLFGALHVKCNYFFTIFGLKKKAKKRSVWLKQNSKVEGR